MSEFPPPAVPGGAAVDNPPALTPAAVEAVLADFRSWLNQLAAAPGEAAPPAGDAEPIDLHTLLGQFVALRHDVSLQTKASRTQQEQSAEALRQLGQALDSLHEAQAAGQQAPDEQLRPLLKTLVDAYDALPVAGREVRRLQETLLPSLEQLTVEEGPPAGWLDELDEFVPPAEPEPLVQPRRSLWQRWFGGGQAGPEPVHEERP